MFEQYLDNITDAIKTMKESQSKAIKDAAQLMADTLIQDHMIYAFGSGHSMLLAQEIHGRAGGLYPIAQIAEPMRGKAEKLEGFGTILVEGIPLKKDDMVIVISNSGRNPEPIEVAIEAKKHGCKVVVVTAMKHSKSVGSRHSSGKMLYDFGDIVLDTCGPIGDASIEYKNFDGKAGALSTVLGAAILNAVMVDAIQIMLDKGYEPPVLRSANLDNSEEHNMKIVKRYSHLPFLLDL
jgi:uncharacterized phosphosugar-binding protein